MENKFKISVIIPVFNFEDLADRAIQSVLDQDFPKEDMEIIVVNDGSTDKTLDVLNKYSKEIRIINQSNQGAVKAANTGFKSALGEYVIKLDGDDSFAPGILKELVSVLDKDSNIDFVYSDYYEESNGQRKIVSPKNVFETIAGGVMFRREKLIKSGCYNEQLFFPEYALFLKNPNWQGFHIKTPFYIYYRRSASLTGDYKRVEQGIQQLKDFFPECIDKINKIRSY
ncbi:glycosyltransferase family 2 protein [Patescibacteria group bacterium]|nr:glycosyltransferase family 2 protein [Patescibacteria group bacterium]